MDTLYKQSPCEKNAQADFFINLFEGNLFPLAILDDKLEMVTTNRAFCNALGLSASDRPAQQYLISELPFYYHDDFRNYFDNCSYLENQVFETQFYVENKKNGVQNFLLKISSSIGHHRFQGAVLTLTPLPVNQKENDLQMEHVAQIAAHDLREPLRVIGNFTQLLFKRYNEEFDNVGKAYLQYITEGVKRMDSMLTDVLILSKIEGQPNWHTSIEPYKIIKEVEKEFNSKLRQTGGSIEIGALPDYIWATRCKIKTLFLQLIGNALKFSNKNHKPLIKISGDENEHYWHFSVTDNGIGISAEFQKKVFLLFKRLNRREEYSGNGVGLTICKKIVEQHEGKIWVASESSQGSTFNFTIKKPPVD